MSDASDRAIPRVLIVLEFLPHYRAGLIERLVSTPDLDIVFALGAQAREPGIKPLKLNRAHYVLNNRRLGPLLFQTGLSKILRKEGIAIVVFAGDVKHISAWVWSAYLRVTKRAPVMFWTIGWHSPESGFRRFVRLSFYRLANHLLLYGEHGKNIGIRMGYPADRISVIGNSLPERPGGESRPSLAEELGKIPMNQEIVGAVIRLTSIKRLDLVIDAVCALRDGGRDVGVLFVGEGESKDSLERRARELRVPLYLPGPAYAYRDLDLIYSRMTATVVPGAVGLTAIQSLQSGVPVVTHGEMDQQMPEAEAVIDGLTGFLYRPYGDVPALTEAIRAALDCDRDRLNQQCRAEVSRGWTAEASASAIVRVLGRELQSR